MYGAKGTPACFLRGLENIEWVLLLFPFVSVSWADYWKTVIPAEKENNNFQGPFCVSTLRPNTETGRICILLFSRAPEWWFSNFVSKNPKVLDILEIPLPQIQSAYSVVLIQVCSNEHICFFKKIMFPEYSDRDQIFQSQTWITIE